MYDMGIIANQRQLNVGPLLTTLPHHEPNIVFNVYAYRLPHLLHKYQHTQDGDPMLS